MIFENLKSKNWKKIFILAIYRIILFRFWHKNRRRRRRIVFQLVWGGYNLIHENGNRINPIRLLQRVKSYSLSEDLKSHAVGATLKEKEKYFKKSSKYQGDVKKVATQQSWQK